MAKRPRKLLPERLEVESAESLAHSKSEYAENGHGTRIPASPPTNLERETDAASCEVNFNTL